jgi:hypothetical protein
LLFLIDVGALILIVVLQLLAAELVRLPVIKRQVKQIELSVLSIWNLQVADEIVLMHPLHGRKAVSLRCPFGDQARAVDSVPLFKAPLTDITG